MRFLKEKNYLTLIENSLGTKQFRNLYFENDEGKVVDLLEDGNLSCSYFVSSVLHHIGLIDLHVTVSSTLKELEDTDKFLAVTKDYQPGDILLWSETIESNGHQHLGFYMGGDTAISNSPSEKTVIKHHYTYNDKRPIVMAFRPRFVFN